MRIILAFLVLSVLYTGVALAQNFYVTISGSNTVETPGGIPVDVGRGPSGVAASPNGEFVMS